VQGSVSTVHQARYLLSIEPQIWITHSNTRRVGQNYIYIYGQNYIYTVYTRYFWQRNNPIYIGLARTVHGIPIYCIYAVYDRIYAVFPSNTVYWKKLTHSEIIHRGSIL